jgi:hypothetical protein
MPTLVRGAIDWPGTAEAVMPFLQAAHAEGAHRDWSMEQVVDHLRADHWALYAVLDDDGKPLGAGVVCVTHYGLRSVLEIILFGAELQSQQWIETLDQLKVVAMRNGCSAVQGRGRPGWARYLGASPINTFELEV